MLELSKESISEPVGQRLETNGFDRQPQAELRDQADLYMYCAGTKTLFAQIPREHVEVTYKRSIGGVQQ